MDKTVALIGFASLSLQLSYSVTEIHMGLLSSNEASVFLFVDELNAVSTMNIRIEWSVKKGVDSPTPPSSHMPSLV